MNGYQPFANQGGIPPGTDPAIMGSGPLSYQTLNPSPPGQNPTGDGYAPPQGQQQPYGAIPSDPSSQYQGGYHSQGHTGSQASHYTSQNSFAPSQGMGYVSDPYLSQSVPSLQSDSSSTLPSNLPPGHFLPALYAGMAPDGPPPPGSNASGQQYSGQYTGQQYTGQQYTGQQYTGQQYSGQQYSGQQYTPQYSGQGGHGGGQGGGHGGQGAIYGGVSNGSLHSSAAGMPNGGGPMGNGGSMYSNGAMGHQLSTQASAQSGLTHTVVSSYQEQYTAGSRVTPSVHNSDHPTTVSDNTSNYHVEVPDDTTDVKAAKIEEEETNAPSLPAPRPHLSDNLEASCPMITAFYAGRPARREPLRITSLKMTAKCHVATAFVDVELVCQYRDEPKVLPLQFFMPKSYTTTITKLKIENLSRPKVFTTVVVPAEEVRKYGWHARQVSWDYDKNAPSSNDPELFVLDLFKGQAGDMFRVTLTYFHPMLFDKGNYYLRLPCTIPSTAMDPNQTINDILDIHVTLNTGLPVDIDFSVDTHPYTLIDSEPGHIELRANNGDLWTNNDFLLSYKMWGRVIVGACCYVPPLDEDEEKPVDMSIAEGMAVITNNPNSWLIDTNPVDKPRTKSGSLGGSTMKRGVQIGQPVVDTRGTFCLTVAPPAPQYSPAHPRSCVFILDRSGSMTGEPMEQAIEALHTGLMTLNDTDQFTVVAFDHEQMWWSEVLVEASEDNISRCREWVNENVTANGLTDIWAPLEASLRLLNAAKGLPFVFLITDGCVENEREICLQVLDVIGAGEAQGVSKPRVCTFGIGPFCNHYFLKQLATTARGSFDVAFRPNGIKVQMERMLQAAAHPVLSDLTIQILGLESCELYPFPIPDLFSGQPLLVAGKFSRHWPRSLKLQGKLPGGKTWTQTIESSKAHNMPLDQVFTKTHLDYMTAVQWLNGQEEMLQRIVDLSVASGVPCYHTQTVGIETTPQQAEQLEQDQRAGRRVNVIKYAVGGAAGVAVVAGVTAALVFGDLGATMSNLPIGDAFNGLGELLGGDCCECCGTCCELCAGCMVC